MERKPIAEQVIVITGPTSGIGLATARIAWEQGAKLVLVSRNENALRELAKKFGPTATYAVADVADPDRLEKAAQVAVKNFGGIDTWINNAGASVYGRITEVPLDDHRRVFETNFWGVVYGSLTAVRYMSERGGALINVGSAVSDRAIPLQGMYSASKHAVKGFTDALRMELEEGRVPISVTLIKPGAINTPYTIHARNYIGVEPTMPPPVYAPEVVAQAIVRAAIRPQREIIVGGGGKAISMSSLLPRVADKFMEQTMFRAQMTDRPPQLDEDGLHQSASTLTEEGPYEGHVMRSSAYTQAVQSPYGPFVVAGALVLGGLAIARATAA